MGAGIPMQPGDIAFKSNFATIDEATGIVLRRRADRQFEDVGPELCSSLNGSHPSLSTSSAADVPELYCYHGSQAWSQSAHSAQGGVAEHNASCCFRALLAKLSKPQCESQVCN